MNDGEVDDGVTDCGLWKILPVLFVGLREDPRKLVSTASIQFSSETDGMKWRQKMAPSKKRKKLASAPIGRR
jgi:hypothetical protein